MNTKFIKAAVKEIRTCAEDNETAHALEDELYINVLQAISEGAENAKELATEALKAIEVKFTRWYA